MFQFKKHHSAKPLARIEKLDVRCLLSADGGEVVEEPIFEGDPNEVMEVDLIYTTLENTAGEEPLENLEDDVPVNFDDVKRGDGEEGGEDGEVVIVTFGDSDNPEILMSSSGVSNNQRKAAKKKAREDMRSWKKRSQSNNTESSRTLSTQSVKKVLGKVRFRDTRS